MDNTILIHNDVVSTLIHPHLPSTHTLIYATYFGSKLYGTSSETSDTDIKGLFLPSRHEFETNSYKHTYHSLQTDTKNTSNDVDVDLWSVFKFIDLLKQGDINALDILFSHTNKACVLFESEIFKLLYDNRHMFLTKLALRRGHVGYTFKQLKKYLIKGSNLFVINFVYDYFSTKKIHDSVESHVFALLESFRDAVEKMPYDDKERSNADKIRIVPLIHTNGTTEYFLELNFDKRFQLNQKVKTFIQQLQNCKNKYGNRALESLTTDCVDNKAVSHALRCVYQLRELLDTNEIHFPLQFAAEVKNIKYGNYNYQEILQYIESEIERLTYVVSLMDIPDNNDARIEQVINTIKTMM